MVVNFVCYLGEFSEDDYIHSRPLYLKTTRDFLCLEDVVFHSAAGFKRDMINHGEAVVFNAGGSSSISGGKERNFARQRHVVEGSSVVEPVVGASGIVSSTFRVAIRCRVAILGVFSSILSVKDKVVRTIKEGMCR